MGSSFSRAIIFSFPIILVANLGFYGVRTSIWAYFIRSSFVVPPTSKKLRGHIAFGLSVLPSVRQAFGISHNSYSI